MGVRTLRGMVESAVSCADGKKATFLLEQIDPAVTSGRLTGGKVTISNCQTYGNSYYLLFYIDGHAAGETIEITDQNSNDHELQTAFDLEYCIDDSGEEMAQLRGGEARIEVQIHDNHHTGNNIVDFLSGCELTLEIYHSVSIYVPAPQAEQTVDGKLAISWKPATVTGATGATTYSIVCNMLSDMISVGESMRHVIDIRDAWYGQSVRISIRATCCGATATSSSSFVSIRNSVLTAPGYLKINGTDSYTGATASQSWTPCEVSYRPGTVTYRIRFGTTEIGETNDTFFIVPEEITEEYETTTVTVYGIANGQRSPMSSGVSYTYDSGHQYVKYRLDGEWRLCIPYVFMSGGWAECIPYYYDENGQHECSG